MGPPSQKTKNKIIKILSHHIWEADKNSLMLIYKAVILSRIDYGSIIYNLAKPNIKQIINPIHNQAIRLALGAFRISPINSILCIPGKPPLQIRRNKNILRFVTKKLSLHNQTIYKLFKSPTQISKLEEPATIVETYTCILYARNPTSITTSKHHLRF
jgi:hypothetical protein